MNDGHSLYLETLSELGIVGLALVVLALGTILVGGLRRLPGPERHAYAAFVAGGLMLALHAGVDWDWEMPALFVWFFGAGGVALAAREGSTRLGELGRTPRIVAALAVLVLALTPVLFGLSQLPLNGAADGVCGPRLPDRDQRLAEHDQPLRRPAGAVGDARLLRRAVGRVRPGAARDGRRPRPRPDNWQYRYGQAIVYGVSGLDPRPYAAEAVRLNPLEPLAQTLAKDLAGAKTAARRRDITRRAGIPIG